MAVISLFYSAVNITDYLIVTASKVSNPIPEEAREVFDPPHTGVVNAIIPSSGELDATNYYVRWYSSSDGSSLDLLLAEFVYDAKNKKPISERRFYQVGGIRDIDPLPDQNQLIDPYLDGKNITDVHKQGYGPLAPPSTTFKEYDLLPGGGIELLNDQMFNDGEFMSIEITYVQEYESSESKRGFYNGTLLIEEDTELADEHRDKRLKCEGTGATLAIWLEDVATVPDGRFYYITCNGGTPKEVRVIPKTGSGQKIRFEGVDYDEVSVGLGEMVRIEKYGTYWEVVTPFPGLSQVGERIMKGTTNAKNAIPEDPTVVYSGYEYARLYYWITHMLPSGNYVIDANVGNVSYTHPAGKEGMFVINTTTRQFRTPDSRGRVIKGVDGSRVPGTFEAGAIGEHYHHSFYDNGTTYNKATLNSGNYPDRRQGSGTDINNNNYEYSVTGNSNEANIGKTSSGKTMAGVDLGAKNTVDNIGDVFLRRT